MSEFRGLWIPAELIELKGMLTFQEKAFIGQIIALSKEGECTATNEYFANFFELTKDRVSRILSSLHERGWLTIMVNKGQGFKRTIGENTNSLLVETPIPIGEKAYTLLVKKPIAIGENTNSLLKVENKSKTKIKTNLKQTIKGGFEKIGETAGEILATQQVDGNTAKKIEAELYSENRTQPTNEKKEKEKISAQKESLAELVAPYTAEFGQPMIDAFLNYWTQKNKGGIKEYWQTKPVFETHKRLITWRSKDNTNNYKYYARNSGTNQQSAGRYQAPQGQYGKGNW